MLLVTTYKLNMLNVEATDSHYKSISVFQKHVFLLSLHVKLIFSLTDCNCSYAT